MPDAKRKTVFSLQGFETNHIIQTEGYTKAVDALYNQAVQEYAKLAGKLNFDPKKPFSFKDYPGAKAKAESIISDLAKKMQVVIESGAEDQWLYACKKSDAFIAHVLNTSKVPKARLEKWQDRNLDALSTFQSRKVNGMDLSTRVWNYAGQMKTQMELGIDLALGEGKSAAQLSRDLRQYLVEPDKLFHKVKNKHGNLVLSKNAAAYHPGQGVYRSSYKNAMRLTRSEINMAYRQSDQLRWDKLDFVVGYEVRLSNNHTLNGVPFYDICDVLKGKYPKSFVFKGWHPQCRCNAVPILMNPDEFDTDELNELKAAINGTNYKAYQSKNTVSDLPQGFKEWIDANAERSKNWISQPYFIKDNFVGGNIAGGLKVPVKAAKQVKSAAQIESIQKAWNTRVNNNKFNDQIKEIESQYPDVASLQAYITKLRAQITNGAAPDKVATMVDMLNHKVDVKKLWDASKEERQLEKLLVGVKDLRKTYSIEELKQVYNAVETKIASWESLSLEDKLKKAKYEVKFMEDTKKYSTWKVAQDAYLKYQNKIEYLMQKEDIKKIVADSLAYAKTTKSAKVKELAANIKNMLDKDYSIADMGKVANELNTKVAQLVKDKAAIKSKKILGGSGSTADWTDQSAYTKARKDGALWAKETSEADKHLRDVCGEVWKAASQKERNAAYYYTHTYCPINEPLRGMTYIGPSAKLNQAQQQIEPLTSIINKSSYNFDMWVQRGVDADGVQGLFGINISGMSEEAAKNALVGKTGVEPAFSSCGVSKGKGFSHKPVIYNIYCPKNTKMLYSEPFSAYGDGAKSANWDGISKQYSFGHEAEVLLQRGTKFRVLKVKKDGYRWYIDVEIIGQP